MYCSIFLIITKILWWLQPLEHTQLVNYKEEFKKNKKILIVDHKVPCSLVSLVSLHWFHLCFCLYIGFTFSFCVYIGFTCSLYCTHEKSLSHWGCHILFIIIYTHCCYSKTWSWALYICGIHLFVFDSIKQMEFSWPVVQTGIVYIYILYYIDMLLMCVYCCLLDGFYIKW